MRKYALLILPLCLLLCGGQALGIEAQLTPVEHADTHEIGKEIVLRFDIRWDSDAALNPESLQISPQSEGGDFFSTPYPPKVTANQAGSARIEWAAPLPEDIEPGDRSLALSILARDKAGAEVTGAWTGSLHVDFGEKWSANRIQNFIETRGRFVFLLLIFGFGLLMSLSPCIYPMIPITLAVIGAQNKDKGVLNGLVTSLTYAVGMALVYAIIGFLIASGTSGLTATMQSPIVLVPISLLLMVLSLSMFGAYELQAPQFLRDKLGGPGGSEKAGLLGAFAMGMVAGLIASPCVGPFLSGLLIFFATTGDGVLAFISLFIFGMGMSMLLIAVGTFPALLGNLPQAGGWMETLNRGMGLLLVGMAFYFLRPGSVIPAKFFYPLVGGLMVVVSCFMGAFDSQAPGTGWWDRTRKGLGILVFVFGLMFVIGSNLQNGFVGKAWRSLLADSMPQTEGRGQARHDRFLGQLVRLLQEAGQAGVEPAPGGGGKPALRDPQGGRHQGRRRGHVGRQGGVPGARAAPGHLHRQPGRNPARPHQRVQVGRGNARGDEEYPLTGKNLGWARSRASPTPINVAGARLTIRSSDP
ncbi:hypothetical protein CSA17_04940 [bacterium DOLJORAL78_65_58]|nr:MAG: hypothetical protein CSA17_04940 [bacterium DOLJORAL78_65_58]